MNPDMERGEERSKIRADDPLPAFWVQGWLAGYTLAGTISNTWPAMSRSWIAWRRGYLAGEDMRRKIQAGMA